jgi:hypothetical protein
VFPGLRTRIAVDNEPVSSQPLEHIVADHDEFPLDRVEADDLATRSAGMSCVRHDQQTVRAVEEPRPPGLPESVAARPRQVHLAQAHPVLARPGLGLERARLGRVPGQSNQAAVVR